MFANLLSIWAISIAISTALLQYDNKSVIHRLLGTINGTLTYVSIQHAQLSKGDMPIIYVVKDDKCLYANQCATTDSLRYCSGMHYKYH